MSEMQKNVNITDAASFTPSTSSASSNSRSSNNGQPQKKRQKIEKNKSFGNNGVKNLTKNGKVYDLAKIPDASDDDADDGSDKRPLCSSVSSSVSSISTNNHSSSNSPVTTPSSSRATSLSQLINVQNITNTTPIKSSDCNHDTSVVIHDSSGEHSADEVDRIPTGIMVFTTKSQQNQQSLLNNNVGNAESSVTDMEEFEESLKRECLCGVAEHTLRKPFQSHYSQDANGAKRIANLCEWPTNKLLQFLSNLQLLFDIYLKQNSKGFICARIMDVCDALIRNDHNLIDEIIVLAGYNNAFVQFLAGRVLASFLVIAKQEMNDDWLKKLVGYLFNFEHLNHVAVQKIHFSLEIIKRIVEWKDVELHPLEDEIESETEIQTKINESPIAAEVQAGTSGTTLEAHRAYVHFPMQQPTLETNYFAVHFHRQNSGDHQDNNGGGGNDTFDVGLNGNYTSNIMSSNSLHFFDSLIEQSQSVQSSASFHNSNDTHGMHNFLNEADLHNFQQVHYQNIHPPHNGLQYNPSTSGGCHLITLTDSESFDTTHLKCSTIKILENKWPALVKNMSALIANHLNIENAENCILNFLQLWENIISVKANLSIVETLPFYAQLDKFELLLNQNLSCSIYKQMLCLFNEALCYGSTLALQDMLPDETCMLAHQIVRHVKDFSILESLPRRQPENIVSLIGFKRRPVVYTQIGSFDCSVQQDWPTQIGGDAIEMDKTILQKMVLLVLKSIAVTVKEIRSDSSDSSIDSTDYDAFQDMVLIERSIRDVLQKLESFIKNTLEFHPECHFSKILIHLFDDQDDHLIEAMVCTLDVTSGISFRNNAFPELVAMLNPVYTFLEFLKMISNSSDLLLDLLVSNETCFLLYLLRFLKYIRANWSMLERSCLDFGAGNNTLDEAMSVLIRLRLQISRLVSRQLYPYDISPVLRLLESCESLYEGNELS